MKVIVYSTNLNNYDDLHESPSEKFNMPSSFEYLYYTDFEAPNGWKKVEMTGDSRKESRFYKINSHLLPEHDISIYIDASFEFKRGIRNFPDLLGEYDIALAKHGKDNDIYTHLGTLIHSKKDEPKRMVKQVCKYLHEGLPDHVLTENGIIIRRNNDRVRKMNEIWWKEYLFGSERDQLSLPYAIWKSGVKMTLLPFSVRDNEYLSGWNSHRNISYTKEIQDTQDWKDLKSQLLNNLFS